MERSLEKLAHTSWRCGPPTPQTYGLATAAVLPLLDELELFGPALTREQAIAEHHQMRIAAKRLRYSLEVFAPIYPGAGKFIQAARTLQTALGDLHDCDAWISLLQDFLARERMRIIEKAKKPQSVDKLLPGIEALMADRRRSRRAFYKQARQFWQKSKQRGAWRELRKLLKVQPAKKA